LKQKAAGIILAKPQAVEELKSNDGITRVSQLVSIKNNDVLGGIPSDGYSLPFLRSVPVMYYNTTRLNAVIENHKEFGCSADFPKTWTGEFTVLLGKYRAAIGADAPPPFLISGDQYEWLFETMVYQSGGQLKNQNGRIELNSAIAVNILSQWKNWKEEGLMKIAGNWTATGNHFVYEHFPIICHSSSSMNMIQNSEERNFEYSVEPLPGGAGSRRVLYEGANLYASMYMSPKQKAVAKRFVEFLYAENIQSEIAGNSGYLPCSRTNQTLVSPKVKEQYETNAEPRMIPVHYTDVYEILRGAIWSSVVDGADPKAALDIAQDQVNGLD